ncbi:hypothetical protein EDC19_0249 [Natranaerovirga hydrolytica]|uniref:DUF4476 domain-containing protein n=1 Tax=Natranaerovirga hydrolytica TaxID=680378 RepID=A0A4R1MX66_9FIRM|nr:hypothetical protein [Natranaerovirga hydrolytica]TCK97847.1 hypothetical protein EDC19_0249 [Natranaerovirga hydrolytica]
MQQEQFEKVLEEFNQADIDKKIEIYSTTQGLNEEQYMILLRNFPRDQIKELEKALA